MAMARIEGEPELVRDCENALANQHPPESMGVSPDHGSGKAAGAETIADQMQPRVSENAQRTYEAVYRYSKSPWGLPTRVDMTFANPPTSCESDMGALAAWMLLPAVTGAAIDVPGQRLMLSPRLPVGMKKLHAPVFCARFWAWLDYSAEEFRLKIVQHFGEPLELRELASDASAAAIKLPEPFAARADASLDLSPWREQLCKPNHEFPMTDPKVLRWAREGAGTLLWSATASSDEQFPPGDAFDGYRETRWQTVTQGRTSDWFLLDLRRVQQPKRIEMETTPGAALRVEFSTDGNRWQPLSTAQPAGTNGVWGVDWTAGPVRFLKFVPSRDMERQWQIWELRVK